MFEKDYTDTSFWEKIKNFAKEAGKEVITKALWLYYAAQQQDTPIWAKTIIYGALGYFISPLDTIPDFTPVVGYSDDLGVIAAAIAAIAIYVTDDVKHQAQLKVSQWFS